MKLSELLNTVDLQEFINDRAQLADRAIELQMAIANHPDTPHSLLEILVASSDPDVAQAASGHVNWAGEIAGDWQETLDAAMQTAQLGQNDRLAVELLKFAPVPESFLSEWVPPERIAPGLINPYLPLKYLVKLLDRLAKETTLEPRLQAAESPLAPLSLLEQLAGDLELPVRLAVQSNPNTPPQLIELVQAQYSAASDWNTDSQQLAQLGQSRWERVRLAVAQNPSASVETMMQLAGDSLFKIPLAVAKNPQTPATILAVLAEHSESSIRQAVTQHPNASEEVMHQLFPDCWDILMNRENLPTSILERFFREAATDKPIWKQQELRYLFLGQSNTPAWILAELADVNLEQLRAEKLANRQCVPEPDVLEQWMQDDTMFLAEIAKHPHVLAETLERLSQYPNPWVQLAVAENMKTPETLKLRLLEPLSVNTNQILLERYRLLLEQEQHKENAKSREFMSRRPQSSYALSEAIASDDRTALFNAARNPNTPVSILAQIAKHPDESVRGVLADNRDLPLSISLELIRDPSLLVRRKLAYKHCYRQTSVQVLEVLANDESAWVRELVAGNSDTPLEILVKLANDSNREVKAKVAGNLKTPTAILERLGLEEGIFSARNPNTPGSVLAKAVSQMGGDELADFLKHPVLNSQMPASTLEQLANSNNDSIRYQVAQHPNTPASALEKLAGDSYIYTIMNVASHRNTPPRILEQLAANSDHTTRYNVAQNPNTPPAALEILYNETQTNAPATANSRNQENEIYSIIAANPRTPLAVLEMLAAREFVTEPETEESCDAAMFSGCNFKGVLKALVYNNSLTPQILAILALDPSPKIRSLLERHPNLTPELWQQLAGDEYEEVRGAIASSTNCSTSILQTLASDSDREIRQKVAANRNTTAHTLEFLSQDLNSQVREKVAVNANTATSILEQLARDEQVEVRLAVANNPNTPTSIRESLQNLIVQPYTRESSPTLRFLGRIYNPDTDDLPTLLSEYAQSANAFVRFVALMHPLTPVSILAQGSQSLSWLERCAVADNPSTSVEILQSLDRDSNRIARAIAQTHLQW